MYLYTHVCMCVSFAAVRLSLYGCAFAPASLAPGSRWALSRCALQPLRATVLTLCVRACLDPSNLRMGAVPSTPTALLSPTASARDPDPTTFNTPTAKGSAAASDIAPVTPLVALSAPFPVSTSTAPVSEQQIAFAVRSSLTQQLGMRVSTQLFIDNVSFFFVSARDRFTCCFHHLFILIQLRLFPIHAFSVQSIVTLFWDTTRS
jgi:hypothetical protein